MFSRSLNLFWGTLALIKNEFGPDLHFRFNGIMGVAKITKPPLSPINANTKKLRKLWIGCEIEGFLQSPNVFHASNWKTCKQALIKKHGKEKSADAIEFWEKIISKKISSSTLQFENCFHFKKKKFFYGKRYTNALARKVLP